MKTVFVIIMAVIGVLTSCYEVYNPEVDSNSKILVVSGLITNKPDSYQLILSWGRPYNSSETVEPVNNAMVYVTDENNNQFHFNERESGHYFSDSTEFTGIPGKNYKLHIITKDGDEYESDEQLLLQESQADNFYAEFDTREALDRNSGLTFLMHGANILTDIRVDSLSHCRFTSSLVVQYFYIESVFMDMTLRFQLDFYCWRTFDANSDINLSGGEYSTNAGSIQKHQACFLDDNESVQARNYWYTMNMEDTTASTVPTSYFKSYSIHHRILYINQYTLNNETFEYYKSLDEQLQSEGKLFDPIAAQIDGNINCISDPQKKAIGFFEASSVTSAAYIVDFRNLVNSQPSLIKAQYIKPPAPDGCQINKPGSIHYNIPEFWIF